MKILIKDICDRTRLKARLPEAATEYSAGYDIIALSGPIIVGESVDFPMDNLKLYRRIDYIQYHTGLYICPEKKNEYIEVCPRSSIAKKNLMLKNSLGIIDSDYTGEIIVRMAYIIQPEDLFILPESGITRIYTKINHEKIYQQDEKIAQLIPRKASKIKFQIVNRLPDSIRGSKGFGSSGTK